MRLRDRKFRHLAQPLRPHERRVHGRGQGRQRLVGADVGVGPGAPDVLLAAAQGEDVGELAVLVYGLPRDAPGELADVFLLRRHVAGVRSAEHQRHPERLGLAYRHVGTEVSRRFEEGERDRVADSDRESAHIVRRLGGGPYIFYDAEEVRALHEDAGDIVGNIREVRSSIFERQLYDLNTVGLHDFAVAGVQAGGDGDFRISFRQPRRHQGGFHHGVRAVVDGGVGDLQSRQLGDHGLELEDGLEGALADLRLVRRVAGQVLAAGEDRADGGGHYPVVGPRPEVDRQAVNVLFSEGIYFPQRLVFGEGLWKVELSFVLRTYVGEEVIQGLDPDGLQHLLYVGLGVRCESRHAAIPPVSGARLPFPPRQRRSDEADRTLQDALRPAVLLPERFGLPRQPFHLRRPSRGSSTPWTTLSRGHRRASSDYSIRGVAPVVAASCVSPLYVYASRPTLTESFSAKWSLMYFSPSSQNRVTMVASSG